MMEYKGYLGRVEYDDEAGVFHGEVINLRDVITFQGETVQELRTAFQESVDDYLAFCIARNEEPELALTPAPSPYASRRAASRRHTPGKTEEEEL